MSHALKGHIWRKLKPVASSSLQAAECCHIQGVERKIWMWPFCSMARHIQCWNQSPGLSLGSHSTSSVRAALAEVKSDKILPCFNKVSKNTWCCKWRQTQTTGKVPTVKWNSDFFPRSSRNTPGLPEVSRQMIYLHWCRRGQISYSLILCSSIQSPAPL